MRWRTKRDGSNACANLRRGENSIFGVKIRALARRMSQRCPRDGERLPHALAKVFFAPHDKVIKISSVAPHTGAQQIAKPAFQLRISCRETLTPAADMGWRAAGRPNQIRCAKLRATRAAVSDWLGLSGLVRMPPAPRAVPSNDLSSYDQSSIWPVLCAAPRRYRTTDRTRTGRPRGYSAWHSSAAGPSRSGVVPGAGPLGQTRSGAADQSA